MKLIILLAFAVLSLAACGDEESDNNTSGNVSTNASTNNATTNNATTNNATTNNASTTGGNATTGTNATTSGPEPTQAELCDTLCNGLSESCQAILDDFGDVETCITACSGETDTSLEFLQCQIDATDCDGFATCKSMF